MKFYTLSILFLSITLLSCKNNNTTDIKVTEAPVVKENTTPKFQNKGHELVYNFVQKVGNYQNLLDKKDVVYTYTYETPDGKKDVATEKYIFQNELSYGKYHEHTRTFANLEGTIEQGYDGKNYWLKHNDSIVSDEKKLKTVRFKRPTNFYWFTMFQKLLDPGLQYAYVQEKKIGDIMYDVVKIGFSNSEKPSDIYQVYINQQTNMVDQFLFTVAEFGKMDTPLLMQVDYEKIEDILIPTKRKYKQSSWEAEVTDKPWITVNWTNIKFNNGLSIEDFKS